MQINILSGRMKGKKKSMNHRWETKSEKLGKEERAVVGWGSGGGLGGGRMGQQPSWLTWGEQMHNKGKKTQDPNRTGG